MKNEDLKREYDSVYRKGAYENFYTFDSSPETKAIYDMLSWGGLDVLEIGCGEGQLANMIGSAEPKSVYSIDFSSEAIKIANEKYSSKNVRFEVKDYKEVRSVFDVVVMQGVLEHLDSPFEELDYILKNLVSPSGNVVTSSPSFLNPRGYIWMALQVLLDVPMSKYDKHFLCPFDFKEFCERNQYNLKYVSVQQDWGAGQRTIIDFQKRLVNALRDAKLENKNVPKFLAWLEKAVGSFCYSNDSGAAIIYNILKEPDCEK